MAVAVLVLIAHGGVAIFGKSVPWALYVTIPAAVFLLSISVYALMRPVYLEKALKVQTGLLIAGWIGALYWSLSLAFYGVSSEVQRLSWNPILFAFVCAYPVYLVRRTYFRDTVMPFSLRYSHVVAAVLSFAVSGLVLYRFGAIL